jgi:iron complex transport system permease protein
MKRATVVLAILTALLLVACALRLLAAGNGGLSWTDDPTILSIRFSRLFSGLAVGAALGAAGVILQTLLRNPLASPDVVGVSAGASFGVMLNLFLSARGVLGVTLATSAVWQFVPAAAGAAAVLLLLVASAGWTIFGAKGRASTGTPGEPVTLLLTGVVISILCGAAVMFLQYLMPDAGFGTSRLLMGSLSDDHPWRWTAGAAAGVAAVVVSAAVGGGSTLDALSLPHDEAVSVGVNVPRVRLVALIGTGVLCSVAVVIAGPVGFIGLVAPHAARTALGAAGSRHAILLPCAAIAGAALIVAADALVRTINLGAGRMPLGILTALIGGPTLVYLLRKEARGRA